jgi:hypothetical protein
MNKNTARISLTNGKKKNLMATGVSRHDFTSITFIWQVQDVWVAQKVSFNTLTNIKIKLNKTCKPDL